MTQEQQHPITPSPELLDQWCLDGYLGSWRDIATHFAQWGADQELKACLANIHTTYGKDRSDWLRLMRRPKPPSLKEEALALLDQHEEGWRPSPKDWGTIRTAIEALPND
jgi:hypothetical protein